MLRVRPGITIDESALPKLSKLQAEVDLAGGYAARVDKAKSRWGSVKKDVSPFTEVKAALDAMCWGARRCCYCEDSVADEIEHFRPKDLYPESVFSWPNYLYACGPCNGPKNNDFAVFKPDQVVATDVTRARKAAVVEPEAGAEVLLHPRVDDPLVFIVLDIRETFLFQPRPGASPQARERARYTIRTLRLNEREYLVKGRRTAYSALVSALEAAALRKQRDPNAALDHPKRAVSETSHRSVWEEMKRQRTRIEELRRMFEAVPEAEAW